MKDLFSFLYSVKDRSFSVNFGHAGEFSWYVICAFIISLVARLFFGFVGIDRLASMFNWVLLFTLIYPIYYFLGYVFSSDFNFKNLVRRNLSVFCKQNGFLDIRKEEVVERDSNGRERFKYKDRLVYSPDVSFSFNDEFLSIEFRIDGHKFSSSYVDLGDSLSNMLMLPLVSKDVKRGYVTYIFSRFDIERKNVSDVVIKKDCIVLNDVYSWNYRSCPHALITGITGSGKTFFFAYLILVFLKIGANFRVIDPKRADLYFLRKYFGDDCVVKDKNYVLKVLREACEFIDERMDNFQSRDDFEWGKDYSYFGVAPFFIIFDEASAFVSLLDRKSKDEYDKFVSKIVLEGRQAGVFILFAMQRPDTSFLKGALRDQLGLRIALGHNSEDGYKMVFGVGGKGLLLNDKTAGFFMDLKMHIPQEFYTPFLDIDFISEIESHLRGSSFE